MRKFIVWPEDAPPFASAGDRDELSPVTFAEFEMLCKWTGCSDTAYRQFLLEHNFHELGDNSHREYSEGSLASAQLVIEPGEPLVDWDKVYGE
jgi:hypothetical protein